MDNAKVDQKLEVMIIPVSDVERAKQYYVSLGWRLDVTPPGVVQLTPPGSGCSVQFGATLTGATPGSGKGYLVVSDIDAALAGLAVAGIEVASVSHFGPDQPRQRRGSRPPELQLAGRGPRPRWQRLAVPGDHDPVARPGRRHHDGVQLRQRSVQRHEARLDRPRRAREAHWTGRTPTGPTGTPPTWWRSRPGPSCRPDHEVAPAGAREGAARFTLRRCYRHSSQNGESASAANTSESSSHAWHHAASVRSDQPARHSRRRAHPGPPLDAEAGRRAGVGPRLAHVTGAGRQPARRRQQSDERLDRGAARPAGCCCGAGMAGGATASNRRVRAASSGARRVRSSDQERSTVTRSSGVTPLLPGVRTTAVGRRGRRARPAPCAGAA